MNEVRRSAVEPADDGRQLAAAAKTLAAAGQEEAARERFGDLVVRHQRRASRVAYYYLRDRAEADEAVQDAFLKAYVALNSFDERLSFDVWFTRILINGCLDRLKARGRRARWMQPAVDGREGRVADPASLDPSPEEELLRGEASRAVRSAIENLPERQRTVVILTQLDGRPTADVSELTGMSESTVRVHLFRAMRRLRLAMGGLGESRARPVE